MKYKYLIYWTAASVLSGERTGTDIVELDRPIRREADLDKVKADILRRRDYRPFENTLTVLAFSEFSR